MHVATATEFLSMAAALSFVAAGIATLGIHSWRMRTRTMAAERLRVVVEGTSNRPDRRTGLLAALGHFLVLGPSERRQLVNLLHAAGFHRPAAIDWFALSRALLALTAATTVWLLLQERLPPLQAGTGAAAAVIASLLLASHFLKLRAQRRQAKARKEMAFLADLMVLVLESGLSMDQCLRYAARASAKAAPIVHYALEVLIDDLDKGMPYHDALARWGERLGIPEGRELTGVFRHSLTYGTELAPALRTFIRDWRERRINDAREGIGRRAASLTIVMVAFFLPPLLVLTAGPVVVSAFAMKGG